MGPKSKNIAVFGNKSTYLTFDEFLQLPLPEFDPFKEGQRLFIIRKPNFMRRLEQNIVERALESVLVMGDTDWQR